MIWFRLYLNGVVFFPTFFKLSLNLAMKCSWSEPQSAPSLVFVDCIELLHLGCKENRSDFGNDHLVMSKAKFACYSRYLLTSYFFILVPYNEKGHLFWVLVLKELVGDHRTIQLQLLQHYWLGPILRLLWYWIVSLGNELRSFWHFCDCTQVLHFRLLLTMMATPFLLRDFCPQ